MRLKLSEKPREWQKFAWSCAGAATVFTLLGWWRHRVGGASVAAVIAAALVWALVAAMNPGWFRGFYRGGRTLSHWIGRVVGSVLLAVLFVVIVAPLGIVMRFAGKDLLHLRRAPGAASYWKVSRPPGDLRRMF